jgi:hypothetical protein
LCKLDFNDFYRMKQAEQEELGGSDDGSDDDMDDYGS